MKLMNGSNSLISWAPSIWKQIYRS